VQCQLSNEVDSNSTMKKLVDRYGRRISYLRISVTDRCNLRCIYCCGTAQLRPKVEPADSNIVLSCKEIFGVVEVATSLGIGKIRITGGEPLMREDIVSLVRALSKIGGVADLSLTTNGVFLSELAKELKKAGLRRVNVSLDALSREKYKFISQVDCLHKVLEGISKALSVGLEPLKINVVVMKGVNDDEIVEFAQLTRKEPLHVRFIEFMPISCSVEYWRERFIPNYEVRACCESLGELKAITIKKEGLSSSSSGNISSSYRFSDAKGTISFISPITEPFCSRCSRLRLTSDGKLRLCLGFPQEVDIMEIFRGGSSDTNIKGRGGAVISALIRERIVFAASLKPLGHRFNCSDYNTTSTSLFLHSRRAMCDIGG